MSDYQVTHSKSRVFYDVFERKPELKHQTHYCPGCGHGVAHKLVAEAIEELGLQERTIFVSPVGCSVFAYYYFDVGNVQAAHGRCPAVATGVKRACPESIVVAYQGDGDLAAIGTAEILHAANRGEKITVFFINNAIYGMTGGQMAPTTLVGQKSTTSPWGRRPGNEGYPLHVAELLATLEAPVYIERVALCDNKNTMKARKAVRKALELQKNGAGFTFVEILSPCPTIWKMDPLDARRWIEEKMLPVFPLGVLRDRTTPQVEDSAIPQRTMAEALELEPLEAEAAELKHAQKAAGHSLALNMAGFGGQGVLLLGQIVAEMGMREGLEVSWLPSYGPEMRSGSAHCHVCLAEERIGSPLITHPDVLIAMNEISLRKFAPQVKRGGLILYNRSALPEGFSVPQARVVCVPASDLADQIGTAKVANVVLLGALMAESELLTQECAIAVLESTVGTKAKGAALIEMNRRALEAGREFMKKAATPVLH
ncbi:MAG: 2-oxoacid:acceptor oxidoreductase family protein [Acidobacteria bacterium]|nr:2-oxoacid:acceptor oxidoreductase family protein [Acidobacteriota bacterium]MBI3663614.1 2-oxoacid:acceptor oxidoreductase family protein [Acidobacteriota bacterium]